MAAVTTVRWRERMLQLAVVILMVFAALGLAAPAASAAPDRGGQGQAGQRWRFDASAASIDNVARVIGADAPRSRGVTGAGVGVALVDTGVAPVTGLTSGNVVNGPDLSFESQAPELRHLDMFGHGTHLAGIIAGRDSATAAGNGGFSGLAPNARLTSVKVGVASGAVDVTQVIAAIDWVVAHRNHDPANPIRVLNLAYGTDGAQDHRLDPLAHAVENAWRAGIVVVVAGGNNGTATGRLVNPATHPHVIAVGAADTAGTVRTGDDTVTDFSSRGSAARRVDLVAPGRSVVSLRAPGSAADLAHPSARVGERFVKGSGTSQAAAVVAGAVALLLEERPGLTPDQVKALLTSTARTLPQADAAGAGNGELDVARAARTRAPRAAQSWPRSTGVGSVEAARGSAHVVLNGVALAGERDIFGPLETRTWARASSAGTAWTGGTWMGNRWTGDGWNGTSWTGQAWAGHMWSGHMWSGHMWSGHSGRASTSEPTCRS